MGQKYGTQSFLPSNCSSFESIHYALSDPEWLHLIEGCLRVLIKNILATTKQNCAIWDNFPLLHHVSLCFECAKTIIRYSNLTKMAFHQWFNNGTWNSHVSNKMRLWTAMPQRQRSPKFIFRIKITVMVTGSLTLASYERTLFGACQIWSL